MKRIFYQFRKIVLVPALLTATIFSSNSVNADVFSAAEMKRSSSAMGGACSLGRWNSHWLGSQSGIKTYPSIAVSGTDLAFYKTNTEPTINLLYRMNVEVVRSGNPKKLKAFFMGMVSNNHFTKLSRFVPQTWEGTKPSWLKDYAKYNSYDEGAFSGAVLLLAAAQSYGILKPHLSAKEQKAAKTWAKKLASVVKSKGSKGSDAKAVRAAAFTSWGAVAGDKSLYGSGVSLFKSVVGGISKSGSEKYFMAKKFSGKELTYHNMTYGFLTVAAWAIENQGGKGFLYKRGGGGTLIDGLNFLLTQTYYPQKRTKISKKQQLKYVGKTHGVTASVLSYFEFARSAGYSTQYIPLINKALSGRNSGFFSGYYGGYSTCLVGG